MNTSEKISPPRYPKPSVFDRKYQIRLEFSSEADSIGGCKPLCVSSGRWFGPFSDSQQHEVVVFVCVCPQTLGAGIRRSCHGAAFPWGEPRICMPILKSHFSSAQI